MTLPYDAQILEKRAPDASNGGHGYFPGGTLTSAKGSYNSLYGLVESGWEKRDGKTVFTVTVLANTTALPMLPDGSSHSLMPGSHTYTI